MAGVLAKGEVGFVVADVGYILTFDFNAICAVETTFDLPISEIGKKMAEGVRAGDLRTMFGVGLQRHHPGLSDLAVGDLIGALGAQVAAEKMAEALQAAFPAPEAATGSAHPPKRPRQ